jgi:hypothetical protein
MLRVLSVLHQCSERRNKGVHYYSELRGIIVKIIAIGMFVGYPSHCCTPLSRLTVGFGTFSQLASLLLPVSSNILTCETSHARNGKHLYVDTRRKSCVKYANE